jgi:hypothetical protein
VSSSSIGETDEQHCFQFHTPEERQACRRGNDPQGRLFDLAQAGDWDGVRNYEVKGSNSYSKMVARYRRDLLAVHAASEAAR